MSPARSTWRPTSGSTRRVISALELHRPTRTLTAATYGRSMFAYDLAAAAGIETAAAAPPLAPRLLPASPNPMTDATTLTLDLPGAADVTLRIYDITGRLVRELATMRLPAARHEFRWDGRDSSGRLIARGVYVARLEADGIVRTRKISVTR